MEKIFLIFFCTDCGNASAGWSSNLRDSVRFPGGVVLCGKCSGVFIYRDDLTMRAASMEELELFKKEPEFVEIYNAAQTLQKSYFPKDIH